MSVRLRDRDYRQSGLVHRHRVVPAVVVPFFFICPIQPGHSGRCVVTDQANRRL